jgi:hypothetical protein
MRVSRAGLILTLWILCGGAQASELSMYAKFLDDISDGAPETWPLAVDMLSSDEAVLATAIDALLPRMDQLGVAEKRILAKEFRAFVDREEVALALARVAEGDDLEAAENAVRSLRDCESNFCVPIALRLVGSGSPDRKGMLSQLANLYALEHPELMRYQGSPRQWYAQQLSPGVVDDRFVTPLLGLLQDADADFRLMLVRALREVIDARVMNAFAKLAGDTDPKIRSSVLWGLAKRGDSRVYDRLIALAPPIDPESRSRYKRNQYFSDLGYAYWWDLDGVVRRYRAATGRDARKDHERVLRAASAQLREGFPEMEARIEALAGDSDLLLSEVMSELLVKRRQVAEVHLDEESARPSIAQWILITSALASAALGFVLFAWAFRLLKLKFVLTRLPVSKIASAAQGLVALRGRVLPAEGVLLRYPSTGEDCVYYPGVEKKLPEFGFYIEDESGQIRIETSGAVLLSEKRLLLSNDDVHVIGTVATRQRHKPDGEVVEERVLAKPEVPRSAYQGLMHFIIDRVLAANARGGQSRMLFSDPRTCFWIWDDPHEKPLSGGWDFAVLFGVVALLGAWLVVFAASGLAIVDREFAQALAEWGRSSGSLP